MITAISAVYLNMSPALRRPPQCDVPAASLPFPGDSVRQWLNRLSCLCFKVAVTQHNTILICLPRFHMAAHTFRHVNQVYHHDRSHQPFRSNTSGAQFTFGWFFSATGRRKMCCEYLNAMQMITRQSCLVNSSHTIV